MFCYNNNESFFVTPFITKTQECRNRIVRRRNRIKLQIQTKPFIEIIFSCNSNKYREISSRESNLLYSFQIISSRRNAKLIIGLALKLEEQETEQNR